MTVSLITLILFLTSLKLSANIVKLPKTKKESKVTLTGLNDFFA